MIKRFVAALFAVSAGVMLAGTSASARGVGADATDPLFENPDCWNGIPLFNRCTAAQQLWWPLPVDNAGAKTVTMWVNVPSSSANIQCAAWGVSDDYTSVNMSNIASATVFGSTAAITMTGANVPGNGTLWVDCTIPASAELYTLVWNQ
jgi:hypothetical protein